MRVGIEQEDLQIVFAVEVYRRQEKPQNHRQDRVAGREGLDVDRIECAPQNEELAHRYIGGIRQESEIKFHSRDSIKRS